MSETAGAKPPVGVGHVALTVADVEASHRFYTALGLRVIGRADDMSILELRGGTHLLLFQRGGPMLEGRTFEDLDAYRATLVAGGLQPEPIAERRYFGHHIFRARDPDGNEVTISTSHASDLPV